jgi:hemolysin activation/secretion protein
MKKISFCLFLLLGPAYSIQAQESISKNAIGLRFGNHYGLEVEVTYQKMLSTKNRLEINGGWSSSNNTETFKSIGIYQWYWNLEKGLYWYTGAGAGFGYWDTDDNYDNEYAEDNGFFMVVTGDIGIEYHFKDIPLQLSIDGRPEYMFNSYEKNDFGFNAGLGVRYKF